MKVLMFLILFFLNQLILAQTSRIEITKLYKNFGHTSFVLKQKNIDIEGVFIGDAKKEKPLIIFIEGSGARPQFTINSDSSYHHFTPHKSLINENKYNYIFLSKPGIPLVVSLDSLNEKYFLINKTTQENNLRYNNLEFNIKTYENLLKNIKDLFSHSCVILIGHSQGARIAAELTNNKYVSKIVYMSADPLGRIATQYDIEYAKFELRNEEKLEFYDSLSSESNRDSVFWGDSFYSWKSFSKPSIIALSQSDIPILIVYGDQDKNCPNCYVFSGLTYYCKNITTIKYKDYNHNYYDRNGKANWDIVLKDIFLWLENGN